jgi:ATP-dependent DNA helicase RecG
MPEQQNIEYKREWKDEYLKWISGFANAQGGKIFIGIDEKENVVGLSNSKSLMEDLPNKIVNHLGLVVDVNLHKKDGKNYIEINVPASTVPISYHGTFHYRSGSTKQELKGIALQNWLLKKTGKHWEDIPVQATYDDLDESTIRLFIKQAREKDRISPDASFEDLTTLLTNLNLITKDGSLTNAAILLFGKRPSQVSVTASFKIGRFGKAHHDLLFQDIIETNLFNMPERVLETLKGKYLTSPISFKGLQRTEKLEYPEQALREAILNAIIHKDYASTWIFLRVLDDQLQLWNPGVLPEELTIDKLKGKHSSYPRNRNIADVFFRAGYIESWGRGTNKIIDSCIEAGLPEPIIEEDQGGIQVTFLKNIYTEEHLSQLGINERQIKALLHIKKHGKISNATYQEINGVSKATATRDLKGLIDKKLVRGSGLKGSGAEYTLVGS